MLKTKETESLINRILTDTVLLQKVADKVYELILEDLRTQRDRTGNYRGLR